MRGSCQLHKCIKILQETEVEAAVDYGDDARYEAIPRPDDGLNIGTWAVIVEDDWKNWHAEDSHLIGHRGQVVRCVEVGAGIIVYVLIEILYSGGPMVVAKGTRERIASYEEALEVPNAYIRLAAEGHSWGDTGS